MLIRNDRFDTVHSHVDRSAGYLLPVAKLAGARTRICHFRSDTSPTGGALDRFRRWVLELGIRWAATNIVAVSPGTLEAAWGSHRPSAKCQVLHNGIDVARYRDAVAADLTADLGVAAGATVLLHIGNGGIRTKNRERAIRLLAGVRQERAGAVLIFVGRDGQDAASGVHNRQELRKLATQNGVEDGVIFAGERGDIPALLKASQCLLMTSTLEGVPGVVLEGLAAGMPVIATRLPGTVYIGREILGLTLVDASESDSSWVNAILAAIDNPQSGARISAAVEGSPFNGERSVHEYRTIWAGVTR
nr:glycosyltransferase [Microbacterium sp.]